MPASDDGLEGCPQLFSNEEYEERAVRVGGRLIRLLSSTAATSEEPFFFLKALRGLP